MNETLLLPPAEAPVIGQALLFSPEIEKLVAREEDSTGVYTAERFRVRRKEDYQAVIQLLGRNKGMLAIGKLLGCHHKTVAAVRDAEPESIDMVRSKRVTQILTAVDLQIERLIENPGLVPMNVAGLLISQLIDKVELLEGRATQRVEKIERVDIYQQYDEFVEKSLELGEVRELPAETEFVEKSLELGEVRELPAETGLGAGNVLPIEAAPGEALSADIDAESADSTPDAQVRSGTDTALPTTDGINETVNDSSRRSEEGGRGSASGARGGLTQSGYEERNFWPNRPSIPAPPI